MATLSPAVEQRLALLFPPDQQARVREYLLAECAENIPMWHMAGFERLHCAALKISDGDFAKLKQAVDVAKHDFRDMLVWAGFGELGRHVLWVPEKKWDG